MLFRLDLTEIPICQTAFLISESSGGTSKLNAAPYGCGQSLVTRGGERITSGSNHLRLCMNAALSKAGAVAKTVCRKALKPKH